MRVESWLFQMSTHKYLCLINDPFFFPLQGSDLFSHSNDSQEFRSHLGPKSLGILVGPGIHHQFLLTSHHLRGIIFIDIYMYTRWWQLKYFLFSPRKLGKMNPFWRAYFSDGWFNHQLVYLFFSNHRLQANLSRDVSNEGSLWHWPFYIVSFQKQSFLGDFLEDHPT